MEILDDFRKPKTKLIRTSNQGPSNARNKGIASANGEYILPIDADDKIGDTYLEKAVNILDNHKEIGIVYCEAELFGARSCKWDLPEYTFPRVLLHNCIFCTAMFRKSDWVNVGGYKNEMEFSSEDWEFWLSLIERGIEVYRIPETLFYYRIQKISRTSKSLSHHEQDMRLRLVEFHRELYENNLDFIIESYYNLQRIINELNSEINGLNSEIFKKGQKILELEQIKSSRSWKLTEPLRKIGSLMRKFKKMGILKINSFLKNTYKNYFSSRDSDDILVSIIMANYNYENLLERSINSILSQNYDNWELIIIDDGSSDGSINLINHYLNFNPKIKLYQHEKGVNKGLNETLLLGLEHAKGNYVAFLEADDWWENNYLKEKIDILKKYPNVKFIFNDVNIFSDQKTDLTWFHNYFKWQKGILSELEMPCKCSQYFIDENFIPTFSCVFVDKRTLLSCNFNSPIDSLIDFWLWTQLSSMTDFYYINKKLTHWYRHGNSYIQNSVKERRDKLKGYNNSRKKFLHLSS